MADDQLSGRELDLAVAERVFGFRWFHCDGANGVVRNQFLTPEQADTWRQLNWELTGLTSAQDDQFNDDTAAPRYSESMSAAMQVEDRIAELGKQCDYIAALWDVIGADRSVNFWTASNTRAFWLCVHATPEQRCRAALAAIGE